MPVDLETLAAIREEVRAAVHSIQLSNPQTTRCRADYPHEGRLRYTRGNPGVYVCECGQRYVKNGTGGLRNEV